MQNYVDYDVACCTFDYGRKACGVDEMIGMIFGMGGKPLKEVRLLDAGCGTGNYSRAFLNKGIGHITLLDVSDGMLSVASSKLAKGISDGKVDVIKHCLPSLPFADKSFDAITLIHVVHQIDTQPDEGARQYPNLEECVGEAYRVLDADGVLLINMQTQEQALHGCWYLSLIPKAARKNQRKYIPIPDLIVMLRKSGFQHVSLVYRPGELSNSEEELYKDLEGPLHGEWRGTCSLWSLVENDELESALRSLAEMKQEGSLSTFYDESDKFRQKFGQSVLVVGKK